MGKIISLKEERDKRKIKKELSGNRKPLYLKNGKVKVSKKDSDKKNNKDFATRLSRIRNSLDKINEMMAEVRNKANESQFEEEGQ